jgi:hypothetical protein
MSEFDDMDAEQNLSSEQAYSTCGLVRQARLDTCHSAVAKQPIDGTGGLHLERV